MNDIGQTVISQYGNSPRMLQIIQDFNDNIDPSADIDAFYSMVWDLETAQGSGLDFWGKVVDVPRLLEVPATESYVGFSEADSWETLGHGIWYSGPQTGSWQLSDDAYRALILLKALSNISDSTAASYNKLLATLFGGRGRCYAVKTGTMQMQLTFEFHLQPYEIAIVQQSGALQAPAGVGLTLLELDVATTFGFSEATAGYLGPVTGQFTLPATLPAPLGSTYDVSNLQSYAALGFGTFTQPPLYINRG